MLIVCNQNFHVYQMKTNLTINQNNKTAKHVNFHKQKNFTLKHIGDELTFYHINKQLSTKSKS